MLRQLTRLALLLPLLAAPCLADEEPEQPQESRWRLGAALGYGIRSNPLVQSDDIPIYVDLDIAWFGKRWFFDNGDLGFTVTDNDAVTASLVARVNSDLVGKVVNIASRCAGFIKKRFDGRLSSDIDQPDLFDTFVRAGDEIADLVDALVLRAR